MSLQIVEKIEEHFTKIKDAIEGERHKDAQQLVTDAVSAFQELHDWLAGAISRVEAAEATGGDAAAAGAIVKEAVTLAEGPDGTGNAAPAPGIESPTS